MDISLLKHIVTADAGGLRKTDLHGFGKEGNKRRVPFPGTPTLPSLCVQKNLLSKLLSEASANNQRKEFIRRAAVSCTFGEPMQLLSWLRTFLTEPD